MDTSTEPIWRTAESRVGVAWIACPDIGPPLGWRVVVTETYAGKAYVHVEGRGIDRRVYSHKLDFGLEFRTTRGHWIPECDRRAQRWLWRTRRSMNVGKLPPFAAGLTLSRVDQILVRHQPRDY